jgi:hypothetical protein
MGRINVTSRIFEGASGPNNRLGLNQQMFCTEEDFSDYTSQGQSGQVYSVSAGSSSPV